MEVARKVQEILQKYKELQDIIAILGMEELSEDKKTVFRAKDTEIPLPAVPRGRKLYRNSGKIRSAQRDDPWI